jgi:cellulose synthase/poly-beta-1,6-N-acetylglucosamine synthase-like glycosyltransferase
MSTPDISVVVCTQNRAAMLGGALASLYDLATDGFSYEVVVIDNGSTDGTARVIETAEGESKNPLRGVHEAEKGIVPARNRGIREARGAWIAFFDDDQRADRMWLCELFRGAAAKQCLVAGGSVHLTFPGGCERQLAPAVRMLLGEARFGDEAQPYGGRLTPGCGNLMVARSVFDAVGVFERTVDGRGEDTDLFSRIERAGIESWYFPAAVVQHITPPERLAPAYLLKLARGVGAGVAARQVSQVRPARFWMLWLAKGIRLGAVQVPQWVLARLVGDMEAALGLRCLVEINGSFLRAGLRLGWGRVGGMRFMSPSIPAVGRDYRVLGTKY